MVGMMARSLFGASLHVPLLVIDRWQNAHFIYSIILQMRGGNRCKVELTCGGFRGSLHLNVSSLNPLKPDSRHLQRQFRCWLISCG